MQIKFGDPAGEWVCLCGNTCDQDGFFPCNNTGDQVEPTPEDWAGKLYVCEQCGRIIDQDSLSVVGVRSNNTLTNEEKRELYNELT